MIKNIKKYKEKLHKKLMKIDNKWNNTEPEDKQSKLKMAFIENFFEIIESKTLASDELDILLHETGEFLGKQLNKDEQKEFLNMLIYGVPWCFRKVVGEINGKTGFSVHGFDMKLIKSYDFDFTKGYFVGKECERTILFDLCELGDINAIKRCIALGIDVTAKNGNKETILHSLAQRQIEPETLFKTMSMILDNFKVDINAKENMNRTVLHMLALYNSEYLKYFLDNFADKYNVNVEFSDMFGENVLHHIAVKKISEMKKLLPILVTKYGLDINAKDKNGYTILHPLIKFHVMSQHFIELLPLLINEYGLDINVQDDYGRTGLHLLATSHLENISNIPWLVQEYGMDATLKTNQNKTLLHLLGQSRYKDSTSIALWLINNCQINIDEEDENKHTMLQIFLKEQPNKTHELIDMLFKTGVSLKNSLKKKGLKDVLQKYINNTILPVFEKNLESLNNISDNNSDEKNYFSLLEKTGLMDLMPRDIIDKWISSVCYIFNIQNDCRDHFVFTDIDIEY